MKTKMIAIFSMIAMLFVACSKDDVTPENPDKDSSKPNILLIIADDMGLDASPGYNIGSIKPNMPNLQQMLDNGVRFNNVWSYPTCTPTRSSILTGKYGFRTGVLKVDDELSTTETSLQKYLDTKSAGYAHAVIGKWHLSTDTSHPTNMGVGYYAGMLSGSARSYTNWKFTENGTTSTSNEYITTKFTDLAIDWVKDQEKPWFLWLAYTAPHTPFHLPPTNLHSQGNLPTDQASIDANPTPYYMAMLEAMDSEIGRLLSAMSQEEKDNTVIIFIGDNGSPGGVAQVYNSRRTKGSLYQGGINVPMVVSGKGVSRINQTEDALLNTTDLFATIADIAGTNTSEINDSKSFTSLFSAENDAFREYIYSEIGLNGASTDFTIRNATHKYMKFSDGSEALYDLSTNAFENPNLLSTNQLPLSTENASQKEALIKAIEALKN